MTGKEVCKLLNINKSTLRFYRDHGFINPIRLENGYFEYSKDDLAKLFQICKFRRFSNTSIKRLYVMFEDADRFNRESTDALREKINKIDEEIRKLTIQKQKLQQHIDITRGTVYTPDSIKIIDKCTSLNYVAEDEMDDNSELVSYMCSTGLAYQSLVFPKEDLLNKSNIYPKYAIGLNDIEGRKLSLPCDAPNTIKSGQRALRFITKINSLDMIPANTFDIIREYLSANNLHLKEDITSTIVSVNNNNEYTILFRLIIE